MDRKRVPCDGVNDPGCVERFWAKVAEPNENGCRLWTGATDWTRPAYPVGKYAGGPASKTKRSGAAGYRSIVRAASFAFELANDTIPNGLVLRHRCDVSNCCEAAHMELGTQADNIYDIVRRFRTRDGGEGNGNAKLTHREAREIFDLAWSGLFTHDEVGLMYGIARATVTGIKRGASRTYSVGVMAA